MSLYQLQKLMFEVNRNPERRGEYRKDLRPARREVTTSFLFDLLSL